MKLKVKLGNIEFEGVKLNDIHIEGEYQLAEVQGVVSLIKEVVKTLPELMEDVAGAFEKTQEISARYHLTETEGGHNNETGN